MPSGTAGEGLDVGEALSSEPRVQPANVWLDYGLCDCFHVTFGQARSP